MSVGLLAAAGEVVKDERKESQTIMDFLHPPALTRHVLPKWKAMTFLNGPIKPTLVCHLTLFHLQVFSWARTTLIRNLDHCFNYSFQIILKGES